MKTISFLMLSLIGLTLVRAADPALQPIPLREISADSIAEKGQIYIITDNEANVSGGCLRRIEVGRTSLVFTFRNRTEGKWKPDFRIRLYNKYGMELASESVSWIFDSVGPGEVRKEEEKIYIQDLDGVFLHAMVTLPKDWREVRFVVLEGTAI